MKYPFIKSLSRRIPAWMSIWVLVCAVSEDLCGEGPEAQPVLEFAVGLPGKQAKLSWNSEPGMRYWVEKSSDLGADGGAGGGWSRVAMVDAMGPTLEWRDPQAVTQRCFYRVTKPRIEVFSVSPPLLSLTGGTITVHGQCIPDGSFLVLEIEGMAPVSVPLSLTIAGQWDAVFSGSFTPGARVISARVMQGTATLATIDPQIEITATGFAEDGPASLPPAAPVPVFASKPVPGIGVIVKKHPPYPKGTHGRIVGSEECDDGNLDPGDGCDSLMAAFLSKKGYDYYQAQSASRRFSTWDDEDCDDTDPTADAAALMVMWLSKKGYDYYQAQSAMAQSAMASSGLQNNPAFQDHRAHGEMVRTMPAPSGLPGEVSFQVCDIALPCPAGPPLAWISTYRSMRPVSSGHGPGWDFSYNIRIDAASSTAPRVTIHDGGGRADVFHRQADGSYRCDGMFREGRFVGDVFTLTFADQGTWTFKPLGTAADAGKIFKITDRYGVDLTCAYDSSGQLSTVSDAFGRSLDVTWGTSPARVLSVTASTGVTLNFTKIEYSYTPTGGKRESVTAPFYPGQPPVAGPTTYSYASSADPRLDDNLTEIRDGENRLLEGFGYSTDASGISYDVCTSHNRHMTSTGQVCRSKFASAGASSPKGYAVYETDEVGRVTETLFDAQHREIRVREYTGFWTPGTEVGPEDLGSPAMPKLRSTDPDFYETSAKFNADHRCIQLTRPDGSQLRVSYDRDFRPGCPVRERGNARVLTLRSASGEERTVSCEYLPGFGTPEPSAKPGAPIKGLSVKGGRNPGGGNIGSADKPGNPIKGITVKGGRPGRSGGGISGLVWSPRSNYLDDDDDGDGWAARGGGRKGWDGTVKGRPKYDEGGRHTPFHHSYQPQNHSVSGIAAGVVAGIVVAAVIAENQGGGPDDDCDDVISSGTSARHKHKGWDGTVKGVMASEGFVTRMVNAYGQTMTWSYEPNGACSGALITSLPAHGVLYQTNGRGQCTQVTVFNGTDSSLTHEMVYDGDTGFLSSVIRDKSSSGAGLQLTTTLHRDELGRVTRVDDPKGGSWIYAYNPLDQCTLAQSPGPHRISVQLTYDQAGRVIRRDQDHLAADGSPVSSNPSYSTFYRYDTRGRLDQVADEERPVVGESSTSAAALGIENFAVCDITRDAAGQIVRLSTPAACRAQLTDLVCDFVYDERGRLFRRIAGGSGASGSVTEECDYTPDGSLARRVLVGGGGLDSVESYGYDGFHRIASVTHAEGAVLHVGYDNVGFADVSVYSSPDPATGTGELMSRWRMRSRPEILYQAWDQSLDSRVAASPFFDYLTEDDTLIEDRFTPGSPDGEVSAETTIVDRSPAGLIQSVTRHGDLLVSNEYDSAGRLIRCSNGASRYDLERDGLDDVVVCGRTDHFRVAGTPPASETFTQTFVRDSLGRVIQRTDGVGNVWSAAYDSFGRCVSSSAPGRPPVLYAYDSSDGTGPFAQQTSCDVAGTGTPVVLGSLLVRCGELKSTTDSYGHSTVSSYDGLGRLVACVYPDGTSESVSYNSRGFLSGCSHRDGVSVVIDTDALGRVTGVAWPGNPASYQYDALGRCIAATQGASSVSFAYDSLGNPVSETQTGISSAPQVITRSFNHRGRAAITYPGGTSFLETRDEFGNLLTISSEGAPPAAPPVVAIDYVGQRVWKSTQANGVVSVNNYRSNGETSPAGVTDKSFDACVRTGVAASGNVVISSSITLRAPDQTVSRSDTYFASGNEAPGRWKTFTRDQLGRITGCLTQVRATAGGAVATESEVSYTLDLEGRRVTAVGGSNPGAYTQDNALPPGDRQAGRYTTWPGGSLTWDDAGNLLTLQRLGGTLEFVHDAQGRMLACNQPGGAGLPSTPVAEFTYDALGRVMIHKIHRGGELPSIEETRFVHDGGTCIQEWMDDGSGSGAFSPSLTMVGEGGVKYCISTRNGTIYYPHGGATSGARGIVVGKEVCDDRNVDPDDGCSSLITSATGSVIERFDYDDACKPIFLDASGWVRPGATTSVGPLKWMAPETRWVPETGMFHCPGGVYSPDLGMQVSKEKPKPKPTTFGSSHELKGHVTLIK